MNRLRLLLWTGLLCLVCSAAEAHPTSPSWDGGFLGGLAHPLLGLDHLLTILAVGLLSAQLGDKALWALPVAFVGSMLAGGFVGMAGWNVPGIEIGIALSVVLLGLAVAINRAGPLSISLCAAVAFGLFHGHAHGTEMPLVVAPAIYAAGFAAMTIGLQLVGILVGSFAIPSQPGAMAVRFAGALVAACGLVFLATCSASAADADGSVRLDNGKDLTGWKGDTNYWSVEDGTLTAKTTADGKLTKEKYNTFLVWEGGNPADFELTLKYKIVGGNSGVQYRSRVIDEAKFIVGGYQADIDSSPKYTGINYEEKARGVIAQRGEKVTIGADGTKEVEKFGDAAELQTKVKNEDWNEYRIVAKGNHLQHYVNGVLMSEVIDNQKDKASTAGVLALQAHQGYTMTVQFKEIQLKELK